jgi:hypothetical protein
LLRDNPAKPHRKTGVPRGRPSHRRNDEQLRREAIAMALRECLPGFVFVSDGRHREGSIATDMLAVRLADERALLTGALDLQGKLILSAGQTPGIEPSKDRDRFNSNQIYTRRRLNGTFSNKNAGYTPDQGEQVGAGALLVMTMFGAKTIGQAFAASALLSVQLAWPEAVAKKLFQLAVMYRGAGLKNETELAAYTRDAALLPQE